MSARWEVIFDVSRGQSLVSSEHRTQWRANAKARRMNRFSTMTYSVREKETNEYWTAAGDRDDSNTGTGVSFATGGPIYSGTFTPGSFSGLTLKTNQISMAKPADDPAIKESTSEIPILAYKVAGLVWLPNQGPKFAPLNQGGTYGADEDARCNGNPYGITFTFRAYPGATRTEEHEAPALKCACGFYACTDLSMLEGGAAILEVELSGKVIVCERGYRAGHQRVIRAHLRGCHYCGLTPSVASFESECELRLRCAQHTDTTPSVPIADLTALLGVAVDVDSSVREMSA